ncbi:MFS transporter, partial [bacterium]
MRRGIRCRRSHGRADGSVPARVSCVEEAMASRAALLLTGGAEPKNDFQRVFRHRDFRILWFGSLASFFGSWIQNVARGYLVYELTGSKEKLALVSFLGMLPVTILGPVAGGLVDTLDKRKLLIWTQVVFAACALYLAFATWRGFVRYEDLLIVSVIAGITGAVESPARQAVVGLVVPKEDLAAALPLQALPFNLARVVGPAIGGYLVARFGAAICYGIDGMSFVALIFAGIAIRADLSPRGDRATGLWGIVAEGMRYVVREDRLRRLFLYETALSFFGLFYLSMMPAIAKDILHLGADGLGELYAAAGVGAVIALALNSWSNNKTLRGESFKGTQIKAALTIFGVSMLALSITTRPIIAFPIFAALGFSAVVVFNTTNLLFQLIAPEALRGRAIAMHFWAISGIGPFGVFLFGWYSEHFGIDS